MTTTSFKFHSSFLLAAAISSAISTPTALAETLALEEIVVTAQKRAESLQDVPISVSAMSGDKLSETGIPSMEGVATYIPNFNIQQSTIGDIVSIRGVQAGIMAGFEQPIGTFVDGVYRGRGTQSRFAFLDVGMVEVLRGPQGTLFGKNTIGGALNITSAAPEEEFGGSLSVTYEPEAEETRTSGHITGALSDTVRGRLAFTVNEMDDGWVANDYYGEGHNFEEWAVRTSFEWDASEETLVRFKYEQGDWENYGQPGAFVQSASPRTALLSLDGSSNTNYFEAINPAPDLGDTNKRTSIGNNSPEIDFGSNSTMIGDSMEAAIQIDHSIDAGTITAIVAYNEYDFTRGLDADYGPQDGIGFFDTEDFDQTSFEVRFASELGNGFEYIAGLYWQEASLYADGLTSFNLNSNGGVDTDSLSPLIAALTGAGADALADAGRWAYLDQESETFAGFAQGTWDLTDTVRLTVGARYGEETKDAKQGVQLTDFGQHSGLPDWADGGLPAAVQEGTIYALGEFTPHEFNDLKITEEDWTYSVNLQWDLTPDVMVYANMSTGVKSGGFNSFSMSADEDEVAYEGEEIKGFELGAKMSLLDGAAELNVALFDMQYDNMQAAIFTGGTVFVVQNAGKSSIQGIEIDGRWRLTEEITLVGSYGYTDFEYDEYDGAACTRDQSDSLNAAADPVNNPPPGLSTKGTDALGNQICGQDLAGGTNIATPEQSLSLSVEHEKDFGPVYLRTSVDYNWQDDQFLAGDNDPLSEQKAYGITNLTITLGSNDDTWAVSLMGRNIFDEEYAFYQNDTPLFNNGYQATAGRPASYSIRGTYKF
jgi:iron complex outermembrane recepter protein